MATVGVLTLELRLENSHSLKEKRHVVQSLKDRLRGKFNVAVEGRPSPASHCWTQDTTFVAARRPDGSTAFRWLVAGTQGQNPRLAWTMPVLLDEAQAPEQWVPPEVTPGTPVPEPVRR